VNFMVTTRTQIHYIFIYDEELSMPMTRVLIL
jgi:hypothetical protein